MSRGPLWGAVPVYVCAACAPSHLPVDPLSPYGWPDSDPHAEPEGSNEGGSFMNFWATVAGCGKGFYGYGCDHVHGHVWDILGKGSMTPGPATHVWAMQATTEQQI